MDWRQFVMDLETLNPDRVEEILLRHGAHSVTYSDAGDQPLLEPAPGETPLWRDTRITGLFSVGADFAALRDDILQSFNMAELPRHEISELEDRPWEREWLRDFGPMRLGDRLWICPGDSSVDDEQAVIVRLDPGQFHAVPVLYRSFFRCGKLHEAPHKRGFAGTVSSD